MRPNVNRAILRRKERVRFCAVFSAGKIFHRENVPPKELAAALPKARPDEPPGRKRRRKVLDTYRINN